MATLIEIRNFVNNAVFRNKVETSVGINVEIVLSGNDGGTPYSQGAGAHDVRVTWANDTLGNIDGQVKKFMEMVSAKNKLATASNIQSAIDSISESNADPIFDKVSESVDMIAGVTT